MTQRPRDAGISLIEVLVSLAIFAVIGVAGLAVLDTVARTGERTEGRLERLAEIDRGFLIVRRDLTQIRPDTAALSGNVLRLTRPAGEGVTQVTYALQEGGFVRRIKVAGGETVDQPLFGEVTQVSWRVMDGGRNWHADWPPTGAAKARNPHAAELTIDITRAGQTRTVTRLMALPAGQGR